MNTCNGIVREGWRRCSAQGHHDDNGLLFCGRHIAGERNAGARRDLCCPAITTAGTRCNRGLLVGEERCHRHRADVLVMPAPRAAVVVPVPRAVGAVRVGPVPVRGNTRLAAIAQDTQNVHTREVNQQMNTGLEMLTSFPVPPAQKTMSEIVSEMMKRLSINNLDSMLDMFKDMNRWYKTTTCRSPNDNLYKRVLDGLWAKMQSVENVEVYKSLLYRLFQEAWESVGMCCDGHLSRLCNVMVGFDDSFLPPVSLGELLQNAMSAIANKDIETADKINEAMRVFDELAVPVAQRSAWLEAF